MLEQCLTNGATKAPWMPAYTHGVHNSTKNCTAAAPADESPATTHRDRQWRKRCFVDIGFRSQVGRDGDRRSGNGDSWWRVDANRRTMNRRWAWRIVIVAVIAVLGRRRDGDSGWGRAGWLVVIARLSCGVEFDGGDIRTAKTALQGRRGCDGWWLDA